jgi:hypothetical protein
MYELSDPLAPTKIVRPRHRRRTKRWILSKGPCTSLGLGSPGGRSGGGSFMSRIYSGQSLPSRFRAAANRIGEPARPAGRRATVLE